ncbi:MAG: winged helix-turn-helix domain-containing protein, partial [Thermoplasmata archaeon]
MQFADHTRTKNRNRSFVIYSVLKIANEHSHGMKITHIMYRTNLNYKTAREIIDYLIRYGMINESCIDE